MHRWIAALTAAVVVASGGSRPPRAAAAEGEFVPLFNGKDLTGWELHRHGKQEPAAWFVKDGVLTANAGSGWLATTEKFGDFVLKVEWRVFQGGNSGVFLRIPDREFKESPSYAGFEVQVLDDTDPKYARLKPNQFSGSVYHFAPAAKKVFKGVGEWNTFEITVKGHAVSVVYNGEPVAAADPATYPDMKKRALVGRVGLQNHGTAVEYRAIAVKRLGG